MNVRKPADYSAMFAMLDILMTAALPQMELHCEIGRVVSSRPTSCGRFFCTGIAANLFLRTIRQISFAIV